MLKTNYREFIKTYENTILYALSKKSIFSDIQERILNPNDLFSIEDGFYHFYGAFSEVKNDIDKKQKTETLLDGTNDYVALASEPDKEYLCYDFSLEVYVRFLSDVNIKIIDPVEVHVLTLDDELAACVILPSYRVEYPIHQRIREYTFN